MTGVAIVTDLGGIARLQARMARLALYNTDDLLDAVGAEVESQTRRRISEERTTPAGKDWPAWSPVTAGMRGGGHSLLQYSGDLIGSIQYTVDGTRVEVGSNLVYAAIQNFGGKKSSFPHLWGDIPVRTFLGISAENEQDIEAIVDGFIDRLAGSL